ncbi:SMI1/KNR4 family protein [Saccharothrix stipae]
MDDVIVDLCRALFGRAGGRWRQIVYRASFSEGAISSRAELDGDGKLRRDPDPFGDGPGKALFERFGDAALELRVNPDNTYEAVVVQGMSQHTATLPPSYVRVLDPARRPTAPPLPPSALPPAGDPARVPDLVAEYAALFESITGTAPRTEPPATEQALVEVEERFDVVLPADLRALYLLGNGTGEPPGPFGLPLLPLDRVEGARSAMEWTGGFHDFHPDEWAGEVVYDGPADAVRTGWWHPGWVPVASNGHLLFVVVDLAPGPTGRPGQVLLADTQDGHLRYLAPSVTAWLEQVLDRCKAGEYRRLPDDAGFVPTWLRPPDTELRLSLGGTDLATAPAPTEDLDEVRTVTLVDATGADLTPLAALPRLRHVSVTASDIDLTPPRGAATALGAHPRRRGGRGARLVRPGRTGTRRRDGDEPRLAALGRVPRAARRPVATAARPARGPGRRRVGRAGLTRPCRRVGGVARGAGARRRPARDVLADAPRPPPEQADAVRRPDGRR